MEGTAVSATQQVNVACGVIQNTLANLVEVVESFSYLNNGPIVSEAQCKEIGLQAQSSNRGGCVSDAGTPLGGTRDSDGDVGQSSTSESEREA